MNIVHDATNEEVLLGGLFKADRDVRNQVLEGLTLDMFAVQANRDIVDALRYMARRGLEYAAETLVQASNGKVEIEYVLGIERSFGEVPPDNFKFHVEKLQQSAAKRNAVGAWDQLAIAFADQTVSIGDVRAAAERFASALGEESSDRLLKGKELVEQQAERMRERLEESSFVPTRFKELDEYLNEGLAGGTLVTIAARSNMGKTTFANNLLLRQLRAKRKWLVVPLEPGIDTVMEQMSCVALHIAQDVFIKNTEKLDEDLQRRHAEFSEEVAQHFVFIRGAATVDEIVSHMAAERPDGVLIDLFEQALPERAREENGPLHITKNLRALRACAKRVGACVVVLQQIKRPDKKLTPKARSKPSLLRPSIEELKQSGGYEEVSDLVLLLHRDKAYDQAKEADEIEIHIAKQRRGLKNYRVVYEFDGVEARIGQWVKTYEGEHNVVASSSEDDGPGGAA